MSFGTYKTPPIGSFAVANTLNDLRSQILRSPAVRISARSSLVCLQTLLGKTEVRDLDIALVVKKHILWLEIPVNDTILMQAAEPLHELSCVETGPPFTELLVLSQVVKQFSTIQEIHHEIQLGRRLECVMQLDDERTIDLLQDISLSYINEIN